MMELNKIYHGDCLELMLDIPDQSIDMILCDLPYGTTACKWDTVISFEPLWQQYERVIKANGAIVLFGTEPFSSLLRTSNLKLYKYDWMWVKNDATDAMNAKNKPMRKVEKISVFSKGVTANGGRVMMKYYPQGLTEASVKRQGNDYGKTGGSFKQYRPSHKPYTQQFTGYPSDLLYFSKDSEKLHPTQKPVHLFEYLIKTYTNEGDTVLDNCAGSGTTGVACQNTKRNFILMEQEQKYVDIIEQRLANNASQNSLF